jgi:FdrA protein
MIERVALQRGTHRDSVTLMLASKEASALTGVLEASAVSATPVNVDLLERAGFKIGEQKLEPTDLVIAIRAENEKAADEAEAAINERLSSVEEPEGAPEPAPRSFRTAARRFPGSNLAVISVPGPNAAHECAAAIESGLHAFCFSSGIPERIEVELKRAAIERELLLMGPDCGTAILDGVGIGFANELERGPVGLIGASGTGIQQIGCLLDAAGVGISHAIGVGGRDLSAAIGGAMTLHALGLLARDERTEVIAVVGKSPDPAVAAEVAQAAAEAHKPAVLCFPGLDEPPTLAGVETAATLEQAADAAAVAAGAELALGETQIEAREGLIRGLFCGGTLRDEAIAVVAEATSNGGDTRLIHLDREPEETERGHHLFVDYGAIQFTEGRPHPMIDPSLRDFAIEREAADPKVSTLLLDVVLGRCAHPDPAAMLAPAISRALEGRGEELRVIVSLCAAERDPQGLDVQRQRLRRAGALVTRSNRQAALLAAGASVPGPRARSETLS